MKKTLAIILSVIMALSVMPMAFAAEVTVDPGASSYAEYDRNAVASDDAAYIDTLTFDQIAGVLLDWVDRQIAVATADFETFEVEVYGQTIALEIPEIKCVDDIMQYANYLANLEGDFANLTGVEEFASLTRANGDINFIYGVFDFMAANSDTFGKVFRWDDQVFDYGKVGEFILTLDTTDATNKKIVDFYNDYLVGNNIQEWFIAGVAQEMGYTIPTNEDGTRAETFDETISNGIITWFAGLCEKAGILSAEGLAALKAYDLRDADIYAHIKNFVALVQSDNQVKIDTYYYYLLDSVVRPLLKALTGKKAVDVGQVTASFPLGVFKEVYADLAYLEEISGGTVYYNFAPDTTYKLTIANGDVAEWTVIEWQDVLDINFEPPVVNIYTGAGLTSLVQEYKPNNENFTIGVYASEKNQALMAEAVDTSYFAGTEVPAEAAAIMVDANAKALTEGVKIETIFNGNTSALELAFAEIEAMVEEEALPVAQETLASMTANMNLPLIGTPDITIEAIDVVIGYKGWATEDDFIAQATLDDVKVTLGGQHGSMASQFVDVDSLVKNQVAAYLDNPVATVVVDQLTGGKYDLEAIEGLFNYIDTDFVIDDTLLNIAGNYDAYDGAIGQVNHILVGLVNMLISDEGEADLNLVDGDNTNLYKNLAKIAEKSDEVIGLAKDFLSDEEIKAIFAEININSLFASEHGLNLDMILGLDFSDVESMLVCGIEVILDLIVDDEKPSLLLDIHNAIEGLETLDAIAIAIANAKAPAILADINTKLGTSFAWNAPAAAEVADGAATDIIMTNLADMAYAASEFAVAKLNSVANDALAQLSTELDMALPTVNFELGVAKGATWMETITNLTDRVYELADGIIIACDNEYTNTFDKISAVLNAVLPTEAMFSNCSKGEFAVDVNTVLSYIFTNALEGKFNGLLGMFEVKEDAIAGGVSVPKALINSCQHIVDAIFPGTVVSANYPDAIDVQETFTGADSDQAIASGNMKSINARKTHLVPAVLNLVRESGVLPFFAACENHSMVAIPAVPGTCTVAGKEEGQKCELCGYEIAGASTGIDADNHTNIVDVEAKDATCTVDGYTAGTKCADCGTVISGCEVITAGHKDVVNTTGTPASCTTPGVTAGKYCSHCQTYIEGNVTIPATGHSFGAWTVTVAPTCSAEGQQVRTCACGETEPQAIAKTAHTDANDDNDCDVCGDEIDSSFGAKFKAFFQKIINWFKSLFGIA